MSSNLYKKIAEKFKIFPSKTGLSYNNKNYSYQEIQSISAKIANALNSLGLKSGDRIAVQVEKTPYNLFLYLACLQSGIIFLPLNTGYKLNELLYFFEDAKPALVVCDPTQESRLREMQKNNKNNWLIYTLDQFEQGSLRNICELENPVYCPIESDTTDIAVILYTSGTTGKPKGAMMTHGGLLNNALALNQMWALSEKDVVLHALPLFHVHGLFFACHTALLSGACLIFLPKFDVDVVIKYLPQSTIFMGVPTYYIRLLSNARFTRYTCQSMRLFISGSAPLLESTFQEFKEKTGYVLLERYGMTETGINSSNPLKGERKVGTVGLPLPNVNIRIVDSYGNLLCTDEIGHIQIKGDNLFKGYWQLPEKTMQEFSADGYFKTGDMGLFDKDGYLTIMGREKDLIITGGLNVYPKEIELSIDLLDEVIESSVIGLPHPDLGEAVVGVVVKDKNLLNEQIIINYLKQRHANYKIPKRIFFISELPKNTMGKVQKNILREKYGDTFIS